MKACDIRLLLDGKDDDVPTPKHTFLPSFQTPDSRNGETQKQSQLINSCWGTCMNLSQKVSDLLLDCQALQKKEKK
jgi:hypothetical protein